MEWTSSERRIRGWSYKKLLSLGAWGCSVHYNGIFVHYNGISVHYEGIIEHYDGFTL